MMPIKTMGNFSTDASLTLLHSHLYNFPPYHTISQRKSIHSKGGRAPPPPPPPTTTSTAMMGRTSLCIRNKTFYSQIWRREVAARGKKISPRIQSGGPAGLMGSGRGGFSVGEFICIMGKCLELELRALVGTVGEVEGKRGGEKERGPRVRCSRWEMGALDTCVCPPPPSSSICKTIYQQSPRRPRPTGGLRRTGIASTPSR